jgi:hypothetical protein
LRGSPSWCLFYAYRRNSLSSHPLQRWNNCRNAWQISSLLVFCFILPRPFRIFRITGLLPRPSRCLGSILLRSASK